jgi:hypothetical protein
MRRGDGSSTGGLRRTLDPLPFRRWLRPWPAFAMLVGVAAFAFTFIVAYDLFVLTEARRLILESWPLDPVRWLLFPEPNYGPGRLTGMAGFQLTGAVCGVDGVCVNAVGAALVGLSAGLLAVHTRQVASSGLIALVVAVLWLISAPVLGVSIWQSARFDILAFIGVMLAGILWWAAFGRRRMTIGWILAVVLGSPIILALAFNAKEVTYYLPAAMLLLAVVRGLGRRRAVLRNLLLSVMPLAYSAWFIAHALTHLSESYLEHADSGGMLERIPTLVLQGLGLHGNFLFVWQRGDVHDQLVSVARSGYLLLGVALVVGLVIAAWLRRRAAASRGARSRPLWHTLRRAGPWLYLGFTLLILIAVGSRSRGVAAYYMPIAVWAFMTLVLMAIRVIGAPLPRRLAAITTLGLIGLLVAIQVTTYASHGTESSTYRQLVDGSVRMQDLRGMLDAAIGDRPVERVAWRMSEVGESAYLITQGEPVTLLPDDDIWPWLVADPDASPEVTGGLGAAPEQIAGDLATHGGPGDVVIVTTGDYVPVFLAYEGRVLWDPGSLLG